MMESRIIVQNHAACPLDERLSRVEPVPDSVYTAADLTPDSVDSPQIATLTIGVLFARALFHSPCRTFAIRPLSQKRTALIPATSGRDRSNDSAVDVAAVSPLGSPGAGTWVGGRTTSDLSA